MNNFTLFFMYDMVWVSLLATIYATYALLSKPKGDKAVRLTIGFAFAYYLVFFLLSFATSIATAKGLFLLALLPLSALWFALAPYRKSRRIKLVALMLAALYCAFYGIVILLHGMSNM